MPLCPLRVCVFPLESGWTLATVLTSMAEMMLFDIWARLEKGYSFCPTLLPLWFSLSLSLSQDTCPGNLTTMLWGSSGHLEKTYQVLQPIAPAKDAANSQDQPPAMWVDKPLEDSSHRLWSFPAEAPDMMDKRQTVPLCPVPIHEPNPKWEIINIVVLNY